MFRTSRQYQGGPESLKKIAKRVLQQLNLDIRRIKPAAPPLCLLEDPMEALRYVQGGKQAAFLCPVEALKYFFGFGLASKDWHPFVATLKEYQKGLASSYSESILKTYYEGWQPRSAREAYAGFSQAPHSFTTLPPHLFELLPWRSCDAAEITRMIETWSADDNQEHGCPDLHFMTDGLGFFGPTTLAKGEMEYRRLVLVYEAIKAQGYERSHGDIYVSVLRRGSEVQYMLEGPGYHRVSAVAALGHKTVPAQFNNPWFIDIEDVDYWPQVRSGLWKRSEAVAYFNYLFEFDSNHWAREHGLLLEQQHPLELSSYHS